MRPTDIKPAMTEVQILGSPMHKMALWQHFGTDEGPTIELLSKLKKLT